MGLSHIHQWTLLVSILLLFFQLSNGFSNHWTDPAMIIEHSTIHIPAPIATNAPQACSICGHQVAGPDWQNHMGGHILHRLRGILENFENMGSTVWPADFVIYLVQSLLTVFLQVSMLYPSGFCAQSSLNGACLVCIQSGKMISTCSCAYDFRIAPASKISKQKACTNIPIQCKISGCLDVHWKYDLYRHLQERHPFWEHNTTNEFCEQIMITNEEENKLNIHQ